MVTPSLNWMSIRKKTIRQHFCLFNVPVECERPDFDVSDYESIDSCNPDDPVSNETIAVSQDGLCPNMLFSYNEISTLELSLKNSIEYLQNFIDSPNCTRDEKDHYRPVIIAFRNLLPKIQRFLKSQPTI